MNSDLTGAMREATALTRARKLPEATRLILAALSARHPLPGRSNWNEASRPANKIEDVPQLEPPSEEDVNAESDRSRRTYAKGRFGYPLRQSLGEVVKALRLAKLRGFAANPFPGVKPRVSLRMPEGAQFLALSFSSFAGSRDYKLYLPQGRSAGGLPLIVMLHGCTQDPDDFAMGTGMNDFAEEFGFLVAYPSQPASANPSSCWNWFAPKDQMRGAGEPSIIAGLTKDIVAQYGSDPRRVFVAGLSAGGAMAMVMGATYPDIYAAVGVHSGLPYRAATDVPSAFAAMRGDLSRGRRPDAGPAAGAAEPSDRVRTIVFHGDGDQTVHPSNADRIVGAHDRRDGELREVESGLAGGRPYTRTTIRGHNGSSRSEHWLIRDAGHAWSGGNPDGSYTDAAGPNASREMVRFFLEAG